MDKSRMMYKCVLYVVYIFQCSFHACALVFVYIYIYISTILIMDNSRIMYKCVHIYCVYVYH